jgi:plasmid stability protein
MRTTINLPDELLATLKKRAAEQGTTVTALIETAVRAAISPRRNRPKAARVKLTTYGRRGVQPGIDLDDSAALLDSMERTGAAAGR